MTPLPEFATHPRPPQDLHSIRSLALHQRQNPPAAVARLLPCVASASHRDVDNTQPSWLPKNYRKPSRRFSHFSLWQCALGRTPATVVAAAVDAVVAVAVAVAAVVVAAGVAQGRKMASAPAR